MDVSTITRRVCLALAAAAAVVASPSIGQAQQSLETSQLSEMNEPKVLYACYVPGSGSVYRIKEPGTPQVCGKSGQTLHVQFSWTDGVGGVSVHGELGGLDDDDHAQYLLTQGERYSLNGFAVNGTYAQGTIPATGSGVRLMWYPGKGAFRAGGAIGDHWDDHNIGAYSVALGVAAVASGVRAVALQQGKATGLSSFAMGVETEAEGQYSFAKGWKARALGSYSFATSQATARGQGATAFWHGEAIADHTFAWRGRASHTGALALGEGTVASGENSTALGRNASTNAKAGALVIGDASTSSVLLAEAANEFAARFAGGYRFRTSANLSTGCNLPAGGGQWQCQSSRLTKENFADVEGEEVLAKLSTLPIQTYSYITEPGATHLGPMSQDFHAAFGLGSDDESIAVLDAAGVALAGVKALEARTTELRNENRELREELEGMRKEHHAIAARLARLEAALEASSTRP